MLLTPEAVFYSGAVMASEITEKLTLGKSAKEMIMLKKVCRWNDTLGILIKCCGTTSPPSKRHGEERQSRRRKFQELCIIRTLATFQNPFNPVALFDALPALYF